MFTRSEAIVIAAVVVLLLAGGLIYARPGPDPWGEWHGEEPAAEAGHEEESVELITVHVAGGVLNPGVYQLPRGSRVADAVAAAGGAVPEAMPDRLNLAAVLLDGARVLVPGAEEEADDPSPGGTPGTVNVNRAGLAELQQLPGIGPVLASRIIEHRRQRGLFSRAEDLLAVSGIGDKTLERLRPWLRFE